MVARQGRVRAGFKNWSGRGCNDLLAGQVSLHVQAGAYPRPMGLLNRLGRLDERVFTGLRKQGEPAEDFLRRIASGPPPGYNGPAARELYEALREYFAANDAARS